MIKTATTHRTATCYRYFDLLTARRPSASVVVIDGARTIVS
jgi:hypothetical protein